MKNQNGARFVLILLIFAFLYSMVVLRLVYWQVVRAAEFKEIGEKQSTQNLSVQSKRGEILTQDNFPLATNSISYLLYANPKIVSDKEKYIQGLSSLLKLDEASISSQLSQNLFWVKITRGLTDSQKNKVNSLNLNGLGFQQESFRYYPEASMAAQLVGFLGKDQAGNDKGYFGVEGYYDKQLEGRPGKMYMVKDALGNPIIGDIREETKIDGRTLILTVDRTVQYVTEKRLKEGMEKYGAEKAIAIVMDPKTGSVLSMASLPKFDPQKYWEYEPSLYKNPAISNLYEPGSTFKVLIMSAGLDAGVVKPETKCDICGGPIQIADYSINTWNNKYFANSTMTEVIQHSDNTGMVFVGKKLGLSKMLEYLRTFGIGKETGIDLEGEVTGEIRDDSSWYPIDMATATFGQGISITPIQLLTAVSSVANKGIMMRPHVVSRIVTEDGKNIDIDPTPVRRTISEKASKLMTWMMVNAVENGEAKWTKIDGYKIAGKTGTAQIPVEGHYDKNETVASFIGYFPADNPKVSILVLFDRPKSSIYGSETAAPVFFSIARDLINYYNISPND